MTQPTPPIELPTTPDDTRARMPARPLPDGFVERLSDVVAVDTAMGTRVDAGRDWWPLTMTWAMAGEVPGLAGAVARPSSVDEVSAVVGLCSDAGVPVTAMAGRSGVCGGSVPAFGGVALDLCGLSGVVAVDAESLLIDVRAGTFGTDLEDELRSEHGLTLGHWPQSIALSTVGGWLACRSAGQYSTRYGKIEDMVSGLQVVLADGRVVRTGGRAPRAATGPDLTQLFVGSEGTLGVITEAQLRVHPAPVAERRMACGFPGELGFETGLEVCRRVLRRGATPAVLRLYDHREAKRSFEVERMALLIVLDEGDPTIVDAAMHVAGEEVSIAGATPLDNALVQRWLDHRNDVSALEVAVRAGVVVDTVEIAARWSALAEIYQAGCAAVRAVEGTFTVSAHQSHAYTDGACLYFTFAGQPPDADNDRYYRAVWDAITSVTLNHGGTLSHHHGVGLNRGRYMEEALGASYGVLLDIKGTLDPSGVLNPGKLGMPSPFGEVAW